MLRAAQEQAENSVASARAEAEKTRNAARAESERSISDAHQAGRAARGQRQGPGQASPRRGHRARDRDPRWRGAPPQPADVPAQRGDPAADRDPRRGYHPGRQGEVARGSLEDEVDKAVASKPSATSPPPGARAAPGPAEGRPPVPLLQPLGRHGTGSPRRAARRPRARPARSRPAGPGARRAAARRFFSSRAPAPARTPSSRVPGHKARARATPTGTAATRPGRALRPPTQRTVSPAESEGP